MIRPAVRVASLAAALALAGGFAGCGGSDASDVVTAAPTTKAVTTVTVPSWRDLPSCSSAAVPPSPCRDGGKVIVTQGSGGYASISGPAWEKGQAAVASLDP